MRSGSSLAVIFEHAVRDRDARVMKHLACGLLSLQPIVFAVDAALFGISISRGDNVKND